MNRRAFLRSLFVAPLAAALARTVPTARPLALPPIQPRFSFKSRGLVGRHIDALIIDDVVSYGPCSAAQREAIAQWSENWRRSRLIADLEHASLFASAPMTTARMFGRTPFGRTIK